MENAKKKELWRRLPLGMIEFLIERGLISVDDSEEYMFCYWTRHREFWRCKPFSRKLDYLQRQITWAANEENLQKKANDIQIMLGIIEGPGHAKLLEIEKASETESKLFCKLYNEARENFEQYKKQLWEAKQT
jgi:hypothetical protein